VRIRACRRYVESIAIFMNTATLHCELALKARPAFALLTVRSATRLIAELSELRRLVDPRSRGRPQLGAFEFAVFPGSNSLALALLHNRSDMYDQARHSATHRIFEDCIRDMPEKPYRTSQHRLLRSGHVHSVRRAAVELQHERTPG